MVLNKEGVEDVEVEVKLLLHISRNLGCQGKVFEVAWKEKSICIGSIWVWGQNWIPPRVATLRLAQWAATRRDLQGALGSLGRVMEGSELEVMVIDSKWLEPKICWTLQ